jgi:hypothetical protein
MNNGKFTPENYFKEAPATTARELELADTVALMNSPDYKERFIAEYFQLNIRIDKLRNMLNRYHNGTLDFTPSCPISLLEAQLDSMVVYIGYLRERAKHEGIVLEYPDSPDYTLISSEDAAFLLFKIAESDILSEEYSDKLIEISDIIDDENIGYHFWGAKASERDKIFTAVEKSRITADLINELDKISEKYSYIPSAFERDEIYHNIDEYDSEDEDWEDK